MRHDVSSALRSAAGVSAGGGHLGDDQHFFQAIEIGGRLDADIEKKIAARRDVGDGSYWQSLGEDAIAAAGDDGLAALDFFIAHHMVEHQVAGGFAFDHAVEAGFFQNGADAAGGVVDD